PPKGPATAPPPPRCAIRPARVRHVFRRHAEIQQAMGFRRFIFRGVTKVRDEWDLPCAALRRRTGRSLPDPCPAAPNRSGDGAPAPVHGSVVAPSSAAA